MAWTVIDLDDNTLALAQRQLGTTTDRETVNRALAIAAGVDPASWGRGLAWLQAHADRVLDFDLLAEHERTGR